LRCRGFRCKARVGLRVVLLANVHISGGKRYRLESLPIRWHVNDSCFLGKDLRRLIGPLPPTGRVGRCCTGFGGDWRAGL